MVIPGSGSDGAATLEHLSSDSQIQTASRDMDQLSQTSSGIQTESPIASQVQLGVTSIGSQITMSNTSTPAVSQVKRSGVGSAVSNVALSTMSRQPARNTSTLEVYACTLCMYENLQDFNLLVPQPYDCELCCVIDL